MRWKLPSDFVADIQLLFHINGSQYCSQRLQKFKVFPEVTVTTS